MNDRFEKPHTITIDITNLADYLTLYNTAVNNWTDAWHALCSSSFHNLEEHEQEDARSRERFWREVLDRVANSDRPRVIK